MSTADPKKPRWSRFAGIDQLDWLLFVLCILLATLIRAHQWLGNFPGWYYYFGLPFNLILIVRVIRSEYLVRKERKERAQRWPEWAEIQSRKEKQERRTKKPWTFAGIDYVGWWMVFGVVLVSKIAQRLHWIGASIWAFGFLLFAQMLASGGLRLWCRTRKERLERTKHWLGSDNKSEEEEKQQ